MAGNEIYIGKMLERLYSVVDDIENATQRQIDGYGGECRCDARR